MASGAARGNLAETTEEPRPPMPSSWFIRTLCAYRRAGSPSDSKQNLMPRSRPRNDGHARETSCLHAENTSHALPQYATQGSCPSTMPAELGRLIASDTTVGVDRTRTCCEFTESTSTAPLTRTNQGAISGTLVARWTMSNETPGARSMTCMRSCRRSRTAKSV